MELNTLLRGVILGFSIAAPVGPIGILCIRRTLAEGRLIGFVSGLGAATADAFYGAIAGFGLTLFATTLLEHQLWLRLLGGAYLCYLGITIFRTLPAPINSARRAATWIGAFITTFALTIANPLTIVSFLAIFAGVGVTSVDGDYRRATLLVGGVFAGSALWWFLLSSLASRVRTRITLRVFRWINCCAGLAIFAFGVGILLQV